MTKKLFMTLILTSIIIYLACLGFFTYRYANSQKGIKTIDAIESTEKVVESKLDGEIEKENKKDTQEPQQAINTEEQQDNSSEEKDKDKDKDNNEYRYTNSKINAFENEDLTKLKTNISKSTRLKLIEAKTIIQKDKDGNETEKQVLWVSFFDKDRQVTAFIEDKNLKNSLSETLDNKFKKLDFSPIKKYNFENNTKKKIRGIYITANTVSLSKRLDDLIKLAKSSGINGFVIDVKQDEGNLSIEMPDYIKNMNSGANDNYLIKDFHAVMQKLKENGIYTIARIVSFKDNIYAKNHPNSIISYRASGKAFTNSDGLIWISPHDRKMWEYNVAIAIEAAKVGFNEIQFDYVRFPASNGGKLDKELNYKNSKNETKSETIQAYLKYAKEKLKDYSVYISADIYGQISSSSDDMALGQYYEAISNVVDYISPMTYPSHYINGYYGIKLPDASPYKTVYYSNRDSVARSNNIETPAIIRPWIQAFTAKWVRGHINYGPNEIKEQVRALKDLGIDEYILWSPTNSYERYLNGK